MSEYGLPGIRDKDGNRQVVEHTYEWSGNDVTIKLKPPTISQQQEYEDLGEEADASQLETIVDRHLVEPTIPDGEEWTTRELFCFIEGIVDFSTGGGGMAASAVREELARRGETPGN